MKATFSTLRRDICWYLHINLQKRKRYYSDVMEAKMLREFLIGTLSPLATDVLRRLENHPKEEFSTSRVVTYAGIGLAVWRHGAVSIASRNQVYRCLALLAELNLIRKFVWRNDNGKRMIAWQASDWKRQRRGRR